MGYEPNAAFRLRRLATRTADDYLRDTLEQLLMEAPNTITETDVHGAGEMWSPAGEVWNSARSGTSAARARYADSALDAGRMGDDLPALANNLEGADFAELLLVMAQQATALTLIWEAHARGAITLPESLERRVNAARQRTPGFLRGQAAR